MGLFFPSVVFKELRVSDGIDIDMPRELVVGFLEVRVVTGDVSGVEEIEVVGLVDG